MKKLLFILFLIVLVFSSLLTAQVTLTRNYFYDLQAYNILDFDFDKAANNPDFFNYTLAYHAPDNEPAMIKVEALLTATLPAFGMQNTTLVHVISKPFPFLGTVNITSLDIDKNLEEIHYQGKDETVDLQGFESEEFIDEGEFEKIRNTVLATGELPIGIYAFTLNIYRDGMAVAGDQKVISIVPAENLELIKPGGELGDEAEIFTTYPIFQWDTEPVRYDEEYCDECGIYIRVSEYDRNRHSSLQEALDDEASLPFPDDNNFVKLAAIPGAGGVQETRNNFIYPATGAKPLQKGDTYVWQLKKVFPTTAGFETVFSSIYLFHIAESQGGIAAVEEGQKMVNDFIMQLGIGMDEIDDFLQELEDYQMSGEVLLGNQRISIEELKTILDKIKSGEYKRQNIIIK